MPSVDMSGIGVEDTPLVQVFVVDELERGLVCRPIISTPVGASVIIDAPLLNADSDLTRFYKNPVSIYADNNPAPMFRGFFDESATVLRGEQVTLTARSTWSYLRDIKIFTPQSYNVFATSGLTTQTSPIRYFLADNPFSDEHECRIWQPQEIIASCYVLLDAFWQSQASVFIDPAIPAVTAIPQSVYRIKYDGGAKFPSFQTESRSIAPFPDIVFRENTTFGEVMDFAAEMSPGTQVFEVFSNVGTDIYLAYPQSFGSIIATAGIGNIDWRDTGSNVVDLSVETANGAAANRIVARGAAASCAITLMSETAGEDRYITGLVPDWELFTDSTTVDVKGLQGASTYNYDATCTYVVDSVYPQTVNQVLANPMIGKPGQPEYIKGYEDVGRKYRLPNWFEFADIETKGDLLIDQRTGEAIGVQAFFEVAKYQGMSDDETPTPVYKYTWFETTNFRFDQKSKTITFNEVIMTDYIGTVADVQYSIDPSKGPKLARVAVTFTYSHPNYTLVADSLIDAGGVLPTSTATAITTGQVYDFTDDALGYTQISNIMMPLYASYGEYIPIDTGVKKVQRVPLPEQFPVIYDKFLIAAKTSDAPDTFNAAGVLAYISENFFQANPGGAEALVNPAVLRDDSYRLRQKCRMIQYLKGRKPRSITATFNQLVPGARRGMTLGVENVQNINALAGDIIDSVTHDISRGFTTVRTTNQPSSDMVDRIAN